MSKMLLSFLNFTHYDLHLPHYAYILIYECSIRVFQTLTVLLEYNNNNNNNCDRVCKNQSYLHIKFDLILSLSNLITLFPNIVFYQNFYHVHRVK